MKFIRYALVLALLSSGGLFAETGKPAKGAKYKKIEAKKKQTQAYSRREAPKKSAQDRYGKPAGSYKKMETANAKKHEKGLRKPTTKPAVKKAAAQDRPAVATTTKTEPTWFQKAERLVGLGAAGAAATKAVATHREAGYHRGPQGWHHSFGPGWGDKGFVEGVNEHGHWVFAGYRPMWWATNYPTYYKDVIHPLYKKSSLYAKEEALRLKEQPTTRFKK